MEEHNIRNIKAFWSTQPLREIVQVEPGARATFDPD
jgi:hypothetical protein